MCTREGGLGIGDLGTRDAGTNRVAPASAASVPALHTANSRKCLGLSRSAPLSSRKLRSSAPAAAIFPPLPRSPTGRPRDRRRRHFRGRGGRRRRQVKQPGAEEGGCDPAWRGSRRVGWRQGRRTERKGKEESTLPAEPSRSRPGRPRGAVPFSRRPRGGGRGRVCFHFLKSRRGRRGRAPRGRGSGGPAPSPCVRVPLPGLLFFTLPRHVGSGRAEVRGGGAFCVGVSPQRPYSVEGSVVDSVKLGCCNPLR